MSFYHDMQAIAGSLLTEFDQGGLSLGVYTPGGGPPHNPGEPTYPETPFKGAVRGVSAKNLSDSLIQSTDLVVTMPGGAMTPKLSDRIKIGGLMHSIVKITPKPATGVIAAYEIVVRK